MNDPYGYNNHNYYGDNYYNDNYYGDNYYAGYGAQHYSDGYYSEVGTETTHPEVQEVQEVQELVNTNRDLGLFSYKGDSDKTDKTSDHAHLNNPNKRRVYTQEEQLPIFSLSRTFTRLTTGALGVVTGILLIVTSIALFIWPGVLRIKHLDAEHTNADIKNVIEKTFGWSGISSVKCNVSHVKVHKGHTFHCIVNTFNNTNITISAIFTDNSGKYEIQKPVFNK